MRLSADVSAIIFAILFPFFWLAVWRRKNWARWLLLVAFVAASGVYLITAPRSVEDPNWLHMPPLLILFDSLSILCGAAAFYFLFTGDSQAWFRSEPEIGPSR
jgi:peptidoglycan/LPS O-acetylase OafA/YrhL